MSKTRVPTFMRDEFHALPSREAKNEFLESYRQWRSSSFTKMLVESLERKIETEVLSDESENTFNTLFASKYKSAYSRATRKTLRDTLKSI